MLNLLFDCVFYYVRDLPSVLAFYKDVLGFRLLSQDAVARFDVTGILFELLAAPRDAEPHGPANAHLCLKVLDLDETARQLSHRGVTVNKPQDVEGGTLATFRDPEGNELVLWQYSALGEA